MLRDLSLLGGRGVAEPSTATRPAWASNLGVPLDDGVGVVAVVGVLLAVLPLGLPLFGVSAAITQGRNPVGNSGWLGGYSETCLFLCDVPEGFTSGFVSSKPWAEHDMKIKARVSISTLGL